MEYEYAMTCGEGTLLEYGVGDYAAIDMLLYNLAENEVILIGWCADDCTTGA